MTVTRARGPRLPALAQQLRLPVWDRSQARLRERWGFDLAAADALERSRTLVAAEPDSAERIVLLAAALSMHGEDDLALQQARRAAELQPSLATAHSTLASLLVRRGDSADGLAHARTALDLAGAEPDAGLLYNVGLAEWTAGDRTTAREHLRRAADALGTDGRVRGPWWRLGRRG